jgi:hypothetical protein
MPLSRMVYSNSGHLKKSHSPVRFLLYVTDIFTGGRYSWPNNLCTVQYGVSELGIDISNPAAIGSYADGFDISHSYGDCALV